MNYILQIIVNKKMASILIACVIVLIITNPSIDEFRSHQHAAPTYYVTKMGRDENFFIFSIYSDQGVKYLGVLGNFFEL